MTQGGKTRRAFIPLMLIACILALIPNSQSVRAELVALQLTGVVTDVDTMGGVSLDGSVTVGSTIKGTSTYETETPPVGNYLDYPITSISASIGNYTFFHDPLSPQSPIFQISLGAGVIYDIYSWDVRFDGTVYVDGLQRAYEDVYWEGIGMTLMYLGGDSTDAIEAGLPGPQSFPNLSLFNNFREFSTSMWCELALQRNRCSGRWSSRLPLMWCTTSVGPSFRPTCSCIIRMCCFSHRPDPVTTFTRT